MLVTAALFASFASRALFDLVGALLAIVVVLALLGARLIRVVFIAIFPFLIVVLYMNVLMV